MKIKTLVMAAMAAGLSLLQVKADAIPLNPQEKPEQGVWCSDFPAAMEYAEANNLPLLIFWANPGCGQCAKLEKACEQSDFKTWQAKRKLVMVFAYGKDSPEQKAAYTWIKEVKKLKEYPFIGVYWRENTAKKTVQEVFVGRTGTMPVVKGSLGEQFMASIDSLIPDWDPDAKPTPTPKPVGYVGGEFVVPGTALSHLEAIAGKTASVDVPLVRTNGIEFVSTNTLVAGSKSISVIWKAGEREKMVNVPTSDLTAGTDLGLKLLSGETTHASSFIRIVNEPANATDNPAWVGEKFGFGEWTMDLETAKTQTKAATGDAYTLVFFTGALWCPWCIGIEKFVFATEEFKTWAKDNQINLVIQDNPKRSANDKTSGDDRSVSTVANGAAPTLLRYETGANGRSGAAYLSRKGIGRTAAEAKLELNHTQGYLGGTFCAPEALRTGYPTVILLDKDGVSKARLNLQSDSSRGKDADGAYYCDPAENMQRLRDLLVLAKDEEMCENDQYCSTTSRKHVAGATSDTTLYVNQNVNVFKLDGAEHNRVTFEKVADTAGRGVTFTIVRAGSFVVAKKNVNGDVTERVTVPTATTVVTGNGTVSYDFVEPGTYFLKVSSFDDAGTALYGTDGTKTEVTFRSTSMPLETDNPYYGTALSVPVPVSVDGATVGMLSVTATKKNKVTVKYSSAASSRTVTFTGYWSEPDAYGTARMVANKGGMAMVLSLQADGTVVANVVDDDYGTAAELNGQASVAEIDYTQYVGVYTVALPIEGVSAPVVASTGVGTIQIKANSANAKRKGQVTCAVTYPDGKTTSVSGQLVAGTAGFANLTVFAKSGKNILTASLQIRPDAAEAPTQRAVIAQTGSKAVWRHAESALTFEANCGVYGSYYDTKASLLDCCGENVLNVTYDVSKVADSEKYGAVADVLGAGASVEVQSSKFKTLDKVTGFKISFTRSTGLLKGTTKVVFANGKQLAGTIRAVVLPGWNDCGCFEDDDVVPLSVDLPFVLGTCTFSDKVGGKTVVRGMPFALDSAVK